MKNTHDISAKLMSKINILKLSLFIISALISTGLFQNAQLQRLDNTNLDSLREIEDELDKKVEILALARAIPTVGFDNITANFFFLDFLQYLGNEEERKQTGYGASAKFFRPIIENDPYFHDFYIFLSGSSSLMAGTPEETVKIMNMGLKNLSANEPNDSYYIWRYKGVDELLFLSDSQAAQESFMTSAKWARDSDDPNSDLIARLSEQTADFLAQNPDSRIAQINAWSSILSTALDQDTRSRAVSRIQALGGNVVIDEDGAMRVEYAHSDQSSDN